MKKIFFIAAFAILGLVMVSCDAETLDSKSVQSWEFAVRKENLKPMTTDSTSGLNGGTVTANEGPDDQIIIIIPPKKP